MAGSGGRKRDRVYVMNANEALDRTVRLVRDIVPADISDDEIVHGFQSTQVRLVADEATLASQSGQTALTTLVSLVARMGVQVALEIPDVEILGMQPPLRGRRLRSALIDLGNDLVPGAHVTTDATTISNLTFVLG